MISAKEYKEQNFMTFDKSMEREKATARELVQATGDNLIQNNKIEKALDFLLRQQTTLSFSINLNTILAFSLDFKQAKFNFDGNKQWLNDTAHFPFIFNEAIISGIVDVYSGIVSLAHRDEERVNPYFADDVIYNAQSIIYFKKFEELNAEDQKSAATFYDKVTDQINDLLKDNGYHYVFELAGDYQTASYHFNLTDFKH